MNRGKFALLSLSACLLATVAEAQEPGTKQADKQQVEEQQIEQLQHETAALEKEVDRLKRFKISGYIQAQYQHGQEDASLDVGEESNEADRGGFNRMGIRRGRLKLAYEGAVTSGVFQIDITEKGVQVKDAYFNLQDPWIRTLGFRAGIFNRPFGFEIGNSSSRREAPERSTVFRTLFPDERDFGGMLVVQAPQSSPWSVLRLEAGLFAGNGVNLDTDNKKDFIGHLSAFKDFGTIALGGGFAYYHGQVYQGSSEVYRMRGDRFVLYNSESNVGRYAKRQYFGFDLEFSLTSALGETDLSVEYLFGQQPAAEGNTTQSPNYDKRPTSPTYIREFNGGYAMLVQSLGRLPVAVVAKYDWYNPNTQVKGDQIGAPDSHTGIADLAVNTFGFGALWDIGKSVRLTAYYELKYNEKTKYLAGYERDRKDDVFTLRLQYKF